MKKPTQPTVFLRLLWDAVIPSYGVWRELSGQSGLGAFLRCTQPKPEDVLDPQFAAVHAKVTLFTAIYGLKPMVEHDRVGIDAVGTRYSGVAEFGILSEDFFVGVKVADGKVEPFRGRASGRADVSIHFRDVASTVGALHNQLDTMAAVGTGEVVIRGNILFADNLNVAMERISDYFPSSLN
jgi:hypothetical protein